MTKIKICGLRRLEDVEAVNEVRPDYCGFILEVPGRRRSITRERLRELVKGLDPGILPVGVFLNAPPELPALLLEEGVIAAAQLHGQEDEAYIETLKSRTNRPVIKAFSIRGARDIEVACQSRADYILLDQGGGGSGTTFDWNLVPAISRPWFLAGGLGPENLADAVSRLRPWAVDMSSSLETEGFKDLAKMRRVMEILRQS